MEYLVQSVKVQVADGCNSEPLTKYYFWLQYKYSELTVHNRMLITEGSNPGAPAEVRCEIHWQIISQIQTFGLRPSVMLM